MGRTSELSEVMSTDGIISIKPTEAEPSQVSLSCKLNGNSYIQSTITGIDNNHNHMVVKDSN